MRIVTILYQKSAILLMNFSKHYLSKKAQVATEYLMLFGICLIIIAALSSYAFIQYGDATSLSQSTQAIKELSEASNKVYSLGEGSSIITNISLPSGVLSFIPMGKVIILTISNTSPPSEDILEFDFNVSGSLPISQGYHTIVVSNINGVVVFGEI